MERETTERACKHHQSTCYVILHFQSIAYFTEKRVVAGGLLPVLQREIKHLEHQETICRPREIDVRATCGKETNCPSRFARF